MGILNSISDNLKETHKALDSVITNMENAGNENANSKSDNSGIGVAFAYMIVTILAYLLIAKILGSKNSVLEVFVTNAWDDVSGGSTRTMMQKVLSDFMGNGEFNGNTTTNFYGSILDNFFMAFPLVLSFSIIDSFVKKYISGNSKIITTFTFIAGYVLQAIIGTAYSKPVPLNRDNSLDIFLYMAIGGIITSIAFYVIPRKKRGKSIKFNEMYDNIKGIVKYVIYYCITEFLKATIIMLCLALVAQFVMFIAVPLKFKLLIKLVSVISPFIFLFFYNGLSYAGEGFGIAYANLFLGFLNINVNSIEETKKFGELYSLAFAIVMIILCIIYHLIHS